VVWEVLGSMQNVHPNFTMQPDPELSSSLRIYILACKYFVVKIEHSKLFTTKTHNTPLLLARIKYFNGRTGLLF
jgi:hypothetical protein